MVIEFKQIVEMKKEKSKSGLVPDSILIVMKNKTVHQFSNLFIRDETFELLEFLVHAAMARLLRSTATDPAPGQSFEIEEAPHEAYSSPAAVLGLPKEYENLPLKKAFELQKRNHLFQQLFNLVGTEIIQLDSNCTCFISGTAFSFQGIIFLSPGFLCFSSTASRQCQLALPFYSIMKVEKMSGQPATVSITARHGLKLVFALMTDKATPEKFCQILKDRLQEHVESMKLLTQFLTSCPSEDLLAGRDGTISGLGSTFGYLDSTKVAEKNKLRYWVSYFKEFGRNLTLVRLPVFIKLIRVGLPNTLRGEMWEVSSGSIFKRFANAGYYEKVLCVH